jgi:hypothetical protein
MSPLKDFFVHNTEWQASSPSTGPALNNIPLSEFAMVARSPSTNHFLCQLPFPLSLNISFQCGDSFSLAKFSLSAGDCAASAIDAIIKNKNTDIDFIKSYKNETTYLLLPNIKKNISHYLFVYCIANQEGIVKKFLTENKWKPSWFF